MRRRASPFPQVRLWARMRIPRALVLALLMLAPALAGCTGIPGFSESPSTVKANAADFWETAAATHPATVAFEASAISFPGPMRMQGGRQELGLVPPKVAPAPEGRMSVFPPSVPDVLLFENATVDGVQGTLVVTFNFGAHLIASEGTFDERLLDARTDAGFWRAQIPAEPRAVARPCFMGKECPPSSIPEKYLSRGSLLESPMRLADTFVVHGDELSFYNESGARRDLPNGATITGGAHARLLLHNGTTLDRLEPISAHLVPINDKLTVKAEAASGTIALSRNVNHLRAADVSVTLRNVGGVSVTRTSQGYALVPITGNAIDIVTDRIPRLEASLVALPQVLDLVAEAGKVASFEILLVESSGGAVPRVTGFRLENTTSKARFLEQEPFPITTALLQMAQDIAATSDRDPLAGPVTVPALVALGIATPLIAIGESFVEFFRAIFPPNIADGPYEPGSATVARFVIEVPSEPQDAVLVVYGSNFEDTRVTLKLRPT